MFTKLHGVTAQNFAIFYVLWTTTHGAQWHSAEQREENCGDMESQDRVM
jgi:hypothetical protein